MGGLLHFEEGNNRGRSPPKPFLAVPDATTHPSTASVPIIVLLYALLCGFNVPIKGLRNYFFCVVVKVKRIGTAIFVER